MTRQAVELLETRRLLTSNLLTLGSGLNDAVYGIAALSDGGRVLAGTFGQTIDFDPGVGVRNLTARGETDIFLARYTAAGALVWAQSFGGAAGNADDEILYSTVNSTIGDFINFTGPTIDKLGEYVTALKLGPDGNLYISGSFQGTADFDPTDAGAVNRRADAYHDAFIASYNLADGTLRWASTFGGRFDDIVKDFAVQDDGSVITTGYFTRDADFNPTKQVKMVTAKGRDDLFVAKFRQTDSAPIARLQWVYTAGGDGVDFRERDSGEGIALDGRGNVYVTGTFAGEADFDPSAGRLQVDAIDRTDGYILRLSPKGKFDYVQGFGGKEFDGGKNIAIDSQGRIFLSGYFSEEADLDPGEGTALFIARENGDDFDTDDESEGSKQIDLFLSQVSLKGELQWARPIGGDDYEYLGQMQVSGNSVALSGAFAGKIFFTSGAFVPLDAVLTSIEGDDDFDDDNDRDSSYDAFTARFSDAGTFLGAAQFGGSGDDWANAVASNPGNGAVEIGGIFRNRASFKFSDEQIAGQPLGRRPINPRRTAVGLQDLFALSVDPATELS